MSDLDTLITEYPLGEHRAFLLALARPSIEILDLDQPPRPRVSKFGGPPDVPPGFAWPRHRLGDYRFIGQFALADLPPAGGALPRHGLLSFFYAHDDDGESFWGDPDYVLAFHFEDWTELSPVEPPEAVDLGAETAIWFREGVDLPARPPGDPLGEWPVEDSRRDAYWELRRRLHRGRGHLLGYPFFTTLGYDPTPGPDWVSLLTLGSNDESEWSWHDGDWLMAFVEAERMRVGDFSSIRADAG